MLANSSSRGPGELPATLTRKALSCTNCRRRKVKCDKLEPCNPCFKYNLECTYPTRRRRAPRPRSGYLEERDAELLRRIGRLEGLLMEKANSKNATQPDGIPIDNPSRTLLSSLSSSVPSESNQASMPVDDHYAAFMKQQKNSSRHVNSEFWSNLGDEIGHLRQLVEGGVDDEEDFVESMPQCSNSEYPLPTLLFQDPHESLGVAIEHPSSTQTQVLLQFYFANFDPVCKILHKPTATAYLSDLGTLLDSQTLRFKFESLEAVTFAAYLAAVNSMTPEECLENLMESKDVLMARYKYATEVALVRADFLNSLELPTLQAFTIYIVVQRSLAKAKSTWTLIGLALRIAHGLNLHGDGDGREFSAFEAEMRRRLWWVILTLEMKASEDRGLEIVLTEESFNTVMPCNLDDEDFSYDSQHPLQCKTGPTEMTLTLLALDALRTAQKINFRSYTSKAANSAFSERETLVKQYSERVESKYLAGYDFSNQRDKLLYIIGHYWCCKLWLYLYYPLQQQTGPQPARSVTQGLQRAERILSLKELTERHPSSVGFIWYFKGYTPWHAVAVMLAELCVHPQDPLADRAWEIIEIRFKNWNNRVADMKEEMLWGRIRKLLKRARAARQEALHSTTQLQDSEALRTSNIGLESDSFDVQAEMDFSFMDQTMEPFTDFWSSTPFNTALQGTEESTTSFPIDSWTNFMFDIGSLDNGIPSD